ncbi:hypothetical protein [Bradyrhizobium sp. sBnM-33]|uniref:hypothetical protein n=1 Tax=Bradyrhizobium sp. sBnM-33 TaxID=2831780 RepID=UPI001BCFEEAB|nr:hypothetical protein [Bradyrhizobium sp. sBnM-33]WOH52709.1 hypothetical protein RX328_11605 [Bradyrhizobium sp. sBnM-33]
MAAALLPTEQHCCWADRLSHAPVAQGEKEGLFVRSAAPEAARAFSLRNKACELKKERIGRFTHPRALRQLMLPDFGSNDRANGISNLSH